MSAADVRIRADEIRHERTDARKTRWTASLRFVTASGIKGSMFSSLVDENTPK